MNPERIVPAPFKADRPLPERRIAEMRAMLAASGRQNTAESLRQLRLAFPDVPLADRVQALAAGRH